MRQSAGDMTPHTFPNGASTTNPTNRIADVTRRGSSKAISDRHAAIALRMSDLARFWQMGDAALIVTMEASLPNGGELRFRQGVRRARRSRPSTLDRTCPHLTARAPFPRSDLQEQTTTAIIARRIGPAAPSKHAPPPTIYAAAVAMGTLGSSIVKMHPLPGRLRA
jgi:hypothetical protein